jgi:hypothetical protein
MLAISAREKVLYKTIRRKAGIILFAGAPGSFDILPSLRIARKATADYPISKLDFRGCRGTVKYHHFLFPLE